MATLSSFLEGVRYDLADYESGLEFDDRELINYLNRMIIVVDSSLNALNSDLSIGVETGIDTVSDQNYTNITSMNNGHWDSVFDVWIDSDKLENITLRAMLNKRQWYGSTVTPQYWSLDGNHLLWESEASDAYTTLEIHYKKKTRPLLQSWSDTFTAADTDICTVSPIHTFVTGDGPFQLTTTNTLPAGLSTSTDYWMVFLSSTTFSLATSKSNAVAGTVVDITDSGTGTHTITQTEMMPFDGRWDNLFREMLVLHAEAKRENRISNADSMYQNLFKKRVMEEHIRRTYVPTPYYLGF